MSPSWEVATLVTPRHATAKVLCFIILGPCIIHAGAALFFLTFENIFNIMCIESERGTENPFQVSPCATGWPVRVVFSTTDDQQERNFGSDTLGWFDSVLEMLNSHLNLKTLKP